MRLLEEERQRNDLRRAVQHEFTRQGPARSGPRQVTERVLYGSQMQQRWNRGELAEKWQHNDDGVGKVQSRPNSSTVLHGRRASVGQPQSMLSHTESTMETDTKSSQGAVRD